MNHRIKTVLFFWMLGLGAVQAADLFVGWTRTAALGYTPDVSLQLPGSPLLVAELRETGTIDDSKWDRGSNDGSFGARHAGLADEVQLHGSTTTFALTESSTLRIALTNNAVAGSTMVFNTVMFDATAPWSNSPEIYQVTYVEGGLGFSPGAVLASWTNTPDSGLTGAADYDDFDADLTAFPVVDRTLVGGGYAVFEISVAGGGGASYVDNIAVDGSFNSPLESGTVVRIDPSDQKWTISERLIGMHCRYDDARDSAYADGSKAAWAATNNIGFMRYPGGSTTKTYDWEAPSGDITVDPWDPAYTGAVDSNLWMSLDEYLTFCTQADMIPHLGINWLSGSKFRTLAEGIERASNCVQYVVDQGFAGSDYYIGNEDMWELCLLDDGVASVAEGAGYFVQYAQAIKAVDPTCRLWWQNNNINSGTLLDLLAVAGGWVDGVEFHSKWPYGGDGDSSIWSYDDWKTEFPIFDHRRARTHRDLANTLRATAAAAGYPDLLMANNEYGIGKNQYIEGFNRYTVNLVVIDFLQELFIGNYDHSAFWDNSRQQGASTGMSSLFDPYENNRFNPSAQGYEMLAPAQGATMLGYSSSHSNVYGFAAAATNEFLLYLINKTESGQEVEVSFDVMGTVDTTMPASGTSLVEIIGQWGTNQAMAVNWNAASNSYTATLPAMSYNRIDFAKLPLPTHEEIQSVDSGNWTNAMTWSTGEVPDYLDRVLLKFKDVVMVDSLGNQAGNLRIDGGQAYLDIAPGGSLEVVENGAYPTNGAISFKAASTPLGIRLQGGSLSVGGNFEFGAGGSGQTNLLSISGGTLALGGFTTVATVGSGSSLWDINGSDASITVAGNMALGSGAVMQWNADAGGISPIVSADTKNVTLNGSLTVDLTSMTNHPAEIILIENAGSGSMLGAFTSTNIISSADYAPSTTGGSGNDLTLTLVSTPYEKWAGGYSLVGGMLDNDDGDSFDNLSEYGLGGNPTNPVDPGILPAFGNAGNSFQYIYRRRLAPDRGVDYQLELTDNLVSNVWKTTGYSEIGTADIDGIFESVTNEIPTTGKTNQFIRLKITSD